MRALGLLACALAFAAVTSGCGQTVVQKAESHADKKVAVVDSDTKIGVSTPALVSDTKAAVVALGRTPQPWRSGRLGHLLAQTYIAGCQPCWTLVSAALG